MEVLYSVTKDKKGKETLTHGTSLFPCGAYNRDIRQYITGEIPPHWHHDMEIFLLTEGSARISFADSQ